MDNIIEFVTNNQQTFIDIAIFGFNCLTGTVFGASVITAITKTKDSKWYKAIELAAILTKKAKEEIKTSKKK